MAASKGKEVDQETKDALQAKVADYQDIEAKIEALKVQKEALRTEIINLGFADGKNGAINLDDGKRVQVSFAEKFKVQEDRYWLTRDTLPPSLRNCFTETPKLNSAAYKKLSLESKAALAGIVTPLPPTPTLKIGLVPAPKDEEKIGDGQAPC